jgi:hypothetical protein
MSHELFMDLSEEQQELVSGGGPTAVIDFGFTDYDFNNVTAFENVAATPAGALAQGGISASQLDVTAAKFLFGQSGFPNPTAVTLPANVNTLTDS